MIIRPKRRQNEVEPGRRLSGGMLHEAEGDIGFGISHINTARE